MTIKPRLLLVALIVATLAAAAYFLPLANWSVTFVHWVRGLGALGVVIYIVAYVLGTLLFIPGTVLTAGAGFLYGPVWGVLLVSPASVLGASVAFLLARTLARKWVETRIKQYPKFKAIDAAVGEHGFKMVALMRLQPIFIPFAMLNYALGLTQVKFREYVLASWLGMLPATILYVYLGSAAQDLTLLTHGNTSAAGPWQRTIFWGGLGASVIFVILITRIAHQALQRELGNKAGGGTAESETEVVPGSGLE